MARRPSPCDEPFVGRASERAVLRAALATAAAGHGRIVLLAGEPGIGKTWLAEAFAGWAREAGAEVLAGRCFEGSGAPAFWPWTQVLRAYASTREAENLLAELGSDAADVAAMLPDLRERLPALRTVPAGEGDQARFRFFDAVTRVFLRSAARRLLVIVLDDLHGADVSSLRLLQFLTRELRAARVVVVATLRDVALVPGHPLAETLGELVREQVSEVLELGGLGQDEVAELMTHMGGTAPPAALAARVHARTEGNPLYVVEVVRALARGGVDAAAGGTLAIPATVRMAIGRHLGALSAAAQTTLTQAALFGREFATDAVARAGGWPIDAVLAHVDEAVTGRIVAALPGRPGRYGFAHALFFETLVEALGEARRVALHRRAALALAAYPGGGHASEIAHHWVAAGPAGDPAEAVAWAQRAGDEARRVLAYEEAAHWYREGLTALGWTGTDQPARHAELLLGLGEALKRAGATPEAGAAFEAAAAIGRATGSAELLTRAALGYAPAVSYAEPPAPDPAVVSLLEEAIAAWDGRDASLNAQALARLGIALFYGDAERREGALSAAEDMARRLGDEPALRLAMTAILACFRVYDPRVRLSRSRELVRLADRARDLEALAVGRMWHSAHLMEHGDAVAADAEIAAMSRLAADLRQPVVQWYAGLLLAMPPLRDGRFAEAERAARDTLELGQAALPFAARGCFVAQMLFMRILQGDPHEFAQEYHGIFGLHPDPAARSLLAWVECEAGRVDEARRIVDRIASRVLAAVRANILGVVAATFLSESCAVLEDAEHAASLYEALLPYAPYWVHWALAVSLGPATHALGLLASTLGCHDEAAAHFEHAIAETRRVGARPFLARSLHEYALLLRRHRGNAPQAAALLAESRAIAEEIGMAGLLRNIAVLDEAVPRSAATSPPEEGVFHREGDYWTIGYAERTVQVRDGRGLQYLARLLHQPGQEMPATFLTAGDSGTVCHVAHDGETVAARNLGDAGPVLDARAAAEYRRRAEELRAELAEAEACNDLGHAAGARREIDLLCGELTALHRDRRAASHAERARLTVTKGIKAALAKLAEVHPALADHLMATVKRGYLCVYRPDPRRPIHWRE